MRQPTPEEILRALRHRMPESMARYLRLAGGPTRAQAKLPQIKTHKLHHHNIHSFQEE